MSLSTIIIYDNVVVAISTVASVLVVRNNFIVSISNIDIKKLNSRRRKRKPREIKDTNGTHLIEGKQQAKNQEEDSR
jgi:low affinity Fe/Cu permease